MHEYYEIDIRSDEHAIELSNKLDRDTNVRCIFFKLDCKENFSHEGLKTIARSMRRHPEIQRLVVNSSCHLPSEMIVEAVKVLYLEGNLENVPVIKILRNVRSDFLFDCFRVGRNDKQMKRYFVSRRCISFGESRIIEFAECLHGNTQMQKLVVSFESNFPPEEAYALAAAMCNSQVTDLRIIEPCASLQGDLFRIFCRDGIQASGRIWESLEIDDASYLSVDDMNPVTEVIPFVKTLRISQLGEKFSGKFCGKLSAKRKMHCLYEGLERSCNLLRLDLVMCRLDSDDMRMLCRALRHHTSLKELNIDHNYIGDAGVATFIQHWDEHPELEMLGLYNNEIGHIGALQLINAVVNQHSMKVLTMGDNEIGYSGLQMIGEQLPNLRLKVLGLSGFRHRGIGQQNNAYQSLLQGLKANHFLHKLDLSNCFSRDFGNELPFYTELSKNGRYLVVEINAVAPTIWCTILAKCGSHDRFSNSMIFYFLKEQPFLMTRTTRAWY